MVSLDGVPLNDPTNQRGGSVDLSSLTPERIERTGTVKGPASVFPGSDAMAGGVNVMTQKGTAADRMVIRAEGWLTYLDTRISGTTTPLRNRPKASGGLAVRVRATPVLTIRSQPQAAGKRFDLQIPTM